MKSLRLLVRLLQNVSMLCWHNPIDFARIILRHTARMYLFERLGQEQSGHVSDPRPLEDI